MGLKRSNYLSYGGVFEFYNTHKLVLKEEKTEERKQEPRNIIHYSNNTSMRGLHVYNLLFTFGTFWRAAPNA